MATIVNARDVLLQATSPRVAGVSMAPNIVVDPSQVTGLGLVISNTKQVDFEASSQVYQVPKTGSVTPSVINLVVTLRNIVGTPSVSVTAGSMSSTPTLSGGPVQYTSTIPYANMTSDSVTLRVSVTESSITYTDDMTFVKVREGIDSLNAYLTNEACTLPGDNLGNVISYTGAGGNFKVYQGAVDVTSLCTYAIQANPSSLTGSINSTTGVYTVTAGYPTGTDVTTVTYRATFGSLTLDKIFTLSKAKAGAAGTNGTNGTNGQRGSRTFYVTLGGSTATYSDSLATSTASVSGGPIINDVVTQSNNSVGFSQTKFWDGSVWQIVNAVVDGNLLVSGTVGATAIAANAIRASHILVASGVGAAINPDAGTADISAWLFPTGSGSVTTVTDGISGTSALVLTASGSGNRMTSAKTMPIVAGRTYRVSAKVRRLSGSGLAYFRLAILDNASSLLAYQLSGFPSGGTLYEGATIPVSTAWSTWVGTISAPVGAALGSIELITNWSTGTGVCQAQDIRVEEQIDASMVVAGSLTADRIDTRSLTIKDAAGNVIFSSGTNIPADAAAAGGWNPQFTDWPGTIPTGWTDWNNATTLLTKETSIVRTGPYATRWATGGNPNAGMLRQVNWLSTPLPFGTYITGSVDIYIVTDSGGGLPGLLVRSYTNNTATTQIDLAVTPTSRTTGVWQRLPFTARVGAGQQIFGLSIFVMAAWSGMPGGGSFNGVVLFDNLTFEFQEASTDSLLNTSVALVGKGGAMAFFGGTVKKTSASGAWDAGVYSKSAYTGGAFAEATLVTSTTSQMFGLNTDPTTTASYSGIDYAIYAESTGNIGQYQNGTGGAVIGTWVPGDTLSVVYDGSLVYWKKNGVSLTTPIAAGANLTLYFDSAFAESGGTIKDLNFGPYGNPSAIQPNNQITPANVSTYIQNVSIGTAQIALLSVGAAQITLASITDAQIASLNADKINAGAIRGININAGSFTTKGSYLTSALSGGETTVNVKDTTDFASSGVAYVMDTTNDRDSITYTGKTGTTLTGCSGVLAHGNGATVVPVLKGMTIDARTNEQRFLGDRGDGTVTEIASIGVSTIGSDQVVIAVGSTASGNSRVAFSGSTNSVRAAVFTSVSAEGVWGQSTSNAGVFGTSAGTGVNAGVVGSNSAGGPGVYGISISGPGGYFQGNSTFAHLYLPPLAARPSAVTTGSLALLFTTGGGVGSRNATPQLHYANGSSWINVRTDIIFTG